MNAADADDFEFPNRLLLECAAELEDSTPVESQRNKTPSDAETSEGMA